MQPVTTKINNNYNLLLFRSFWFYRTSGIGCHLSPILLNGMAIGQAILKGWGVTIKFPKAPQIKTCFWKAPNHYTIKINCDGVARGNPGPATIGATLRNSKGDFHLILWRKIDVNTNYFAECIAILESVETTVIRGWRKLWAESDSDAEMQQRWEQCKKTIHELRISSTWREANASADTTTNYGFTMTNNMAFLFEGRLEQLGH
ncbi:hypothetical protein IFM89_012208 [Coptis chinensis]|uniref:RNase H type-1 domain-containing protein n=1 Tax=Coptis chinensis TaxID=261450 RepID=A0A835HJS4_9MAGN|nr:hypothetical protein IFM89_012208 [Coptis chinensis]